MDSWKNIQASFTGLNIGQTAGKLAKTVNSSMQATKERLGAVAQDEITELPQEYKDLETRVDALRTTHLNLLKITKVYETETYDYPTQVQESLVELSAGFSHTVTSFAATNLKGTNLPVPSVAPPPPTQHKTLPHALARAASSSAIALGPEARLGKGLTLYAQATDKIGEARLQQDEAIRQHFLAPWQVTLTSSIAVAMKARAAVKNSRLELDAAKQTLKNSNPSRQEQARLEVENAEDDLVQKTEVAIKLMKAVLENPEPLKNLNELTKAQLLFHAQAAEALQAAQGEIEELSVAAEGEYRKSRDH
ncbi:hypothetical protein EXIGLDRAFT_725710 [Exidia glandulosa HHB12029]|uniref:BAR domain-containing protein n=1 Tax=Exidia glandulosa HHB12029 TaxID=1314781 RepID=A0A165Q8U9_EXIGL|nr:hypothetical protein EXIGLDRAFT_725710 [Exidia glandulosa HHB12029]